MNAFTGRGGGSKSAPTPANPTITRDNLRSTDRVEVILGLCQGPIRGLAEGHKSFYIGDTPLQNTDGSYNFQLLSLDINEGWNPAEPITPVLGGFEDFRSVNLMLDTGGFKTGYSVGSGIQQLVLRFKVKNLWRRGTLANLPPGVATVETDLPHEWRYTVRYRRQGSTDEADWINPIAGTNGGIFSVTGKTRTEETHEARFLVQDVGGAYEIQVLSLTPDNSWARCEVLWEGFYEVTGGFFGLTKSATINTPLAPATAVTRQTDMPPKRRDGTYGIDAIEIRIIVNSLVRQVVPSGGDPGGTFESSCTFLIEAKPSNGSVWQRPFIHTDNPTGVITITGKTTNPTLAEYRFSVLPLDVPYDVRITRITPDEDEHTRAIAWESMQEIVGGAAQFNGTACAHLVAQSTDQFSSIPDFWGIYDLQLVRIPTNYDPDTRAYTGVWDGTWQLNWTNNPAFILHELIMNEEWGLRHYWKRAYIDKFDVYKAAQWCDQLVPDGSGGWQPRWTFNAVLDQPMGAKELVRYVAGTFNAALPDDLNGTVRIALDRDDPAVAVFAPENVIDGDFQYSYTDIPSRSNHVTATFLNPSLNYEQDRRTVFDEDHIDTYGKSPLDFAAMGVTHPQEAIRRAAYKMITATTEREIVNFATNRLGNYIRPFDIILVADPDMSYSLSGRVRKFDGNVCYLHEEVYLESGVQYFARFTVVDPNHDGRELKVLEIPIAMGISGTTMAFELMESPPEFPWLADEAVVSIGAAGSDAGAPKPYRVMSVEESDKEPDTVTIQAIEINRNKWVLVDNATDRFGFDLLNYPSDITPPTNLRATTDVLDVNGELVPTLELNWLPSTDPRVLRYEVQLRRHGDGEGAWKTIAESATTRADYPHISNGIYDIRVRGIAIGGRTSRWTMIEDVQAGLDAPPSDVGPMTITLIGDQLEIRWPNVPDRDLSHYTVRFSPLLVDALWNESVEVVSATKTTVVRVVAIPGTYMVKAVDLSGRQSANASTANTESTGLGLNAVLEETHPEWTGTLHNLGEDTLTATLNLLPGEDEGYYEFWTIQFADPLDPVTTSRVAMVPRVGAERDDFMMSDWPDLTSIQTLSGIQAGDYTTRFEINCDDGAGWRPYTVGDWAGRRFGFRIHLIRVTPNVTPILKGVLVKVDVPDRTERGVNVLVNSTRRINFASPFLAIPTIGLTAKNLSPGDYTHVTTDRFGFNLTVLNGSTVISRFVDWIAVGYGGR